MQHKILLAPLDWGLGHATRCIPLIEALQNRGHQVWLAADGAQALILQEAFPQLPMLTLQGYEIKYGRKSALGALVNQIPKIIAAIRSENNWLRDICHQHQFTWIISDNRYGLWHPRIHSTLLTHQLALQMPGSLGWTARWVRSRLYKWIEKFDECWVPDHAEISCSLSGVLGHPVRKPDITVSYIGWLTRFKAATNQIMGPKTYDAVVLLSGPEPLRSQLESELLKQLATINGLFAIVRGLPGSAEMSGAPGHVHTYNHLPSFALQRLLEQSKLVICRSGYSSLMDLFTIGAKCLLIPTPGQTEQEYLARRLEEMGFAMQCTQATFSLPMLLEASDHFPFRPFPTDLRSGSLLLPEPGATKPGN